MIASTKNSDLQQLDALTAGAFLAPTSGERGTRIRAWLASDPPLEQLQEVFRELGARDKGAARPVRERLDEIRRAKVQEALAAEWVARAQALLAVGKLNIADALAWQRDAAKAGAPLSREPLLTLKAQLAERVRVVEDLQHRVQVQREAAVLLAQRVEVLSTKPWTSAQLVLEALRKDVAHWQQQAGDLMADANWPSVDMKYPPLLESSRCQLLAVWDAFQNALAQAVSAAADPAAALPPVPVWADELRQARGVPAEATARPAKPRIDPELRRQANEQVRGVLAHLEAEMSQGHGKASAGAASALRNALKDVGRIIDDALEAQAHAALAAAGEMEGWQRWRADQLRNELVARAEGLLQRPSGQAIGGRKMQENLRGLREQWKQTDQGGVPNHALWKRFDEACNEAHKVVEAWLEKVRADALLHRAQRLALIGELKAWAAENRSARDGDWRGFSRLLHEFGDRWRDCGHVGDKLLAELQPLWLAAITEAAQPLETLQEQSLVQRQAMIAEAQVLGAASMLRVDAVKALQQRWQAEAQAMPIDRRLEQKLWDQFRKPIDDAFARKTTEREQAQSALGEHDRRVLEAAKALDRANASGDAQRIRAAMAALDAALRGQAVAQTQVQVAVAADVPNTLTALPEAAASVTAQLAADDGAAQPQAAQSVAAPTPAIAIAAAPKKVVAMRGDDRPGMRKAEPAAPARGGKFGDRREGGRPGAGGPGGPGRGRERFGGGSGGDDGAAQERAAMGPRLGDTAFRAQRDALERAQMALRTLASAAHGEALTHLLHAWEKRDPAALPPAQGFGSRVTSAQRSLWQQALASTPSAGADTALLRLEMAADVPTPAPYLDARRAFQLQLLTRRNDPAPAQTWAQDVAGVLAGSHAPEVHKRLQTVLKVLLRP